MSKSQKIKEHVFDVAYNETIDLRNQSNHPSAFVYSEIFKSALLDAKVGHGRIQPGYPLGKDGMAPMQIAAESALRSREAKIDRIIDVLSEHYRFVQPKNAAEWLGMPVDHGLSEYPAWAGVYPWRARTIDSFRRAHENETNRVNKDLGICCEIDQGWSLCGPTDKEKTILESNRVMELLLRMQEEGYCRTNEPDGDIRATALVNEEGEWRWIVTAGGNHRAQIAAALGYEELVINVNLVIFRSDAKYWPHVTDGLYTEREALSVFDNYFEGNPPPVTAEWLRHIPMIKNGR